MKFLRVFETEQERQSIVSQLEYNTLSLAGGVLLIHTASGPGPAPVYDHYIGTINAEQQDSYKILSGGECGDWTWSPARVVVDGVELAELSEHIDLTPGLHTIEIWDDPNNTGYYTMHDLDGYFFSCSYTSMIIPDYVTSIGNNTFYDCIGLTSVTIPNSVTTIGTGAFGGCRSLTSVTIPDSVTTLNPDAFQDCIGLTSVTIPESVTSIDSRAFSYCNGLASISVESGNTVYDSRENCNAIIETATNTLVVGCMNTVIPAVVTSIGSSAFYDCIGLTSVTIPNSVTTIGTGAFGVCSGLTSVTIPNSVISIGSAAFYGCGRLTSVTIPNSVTSIGDSAFYDCIGLTSITCNAVIPPTLGSTTFSNTNNCPIYVPASSVDAYKAANNWSAYASRIQAIQS